MTALAVQVITYNAAISACEKGSFGVSQRSVAKV